MPLTLNQAAKTCGRSKSTLLTAIKSGRLSALKNDRGHYAIEPSELHRVFPFQIEDRSIDRFPEPQPTTPENQSLPHVPHLKREVELLREMLAKVEANAEHWRALANRQQTLLEDKQSKNSRSLLRRLFGK